MTIDELITRLEGAEGPDRWLDAKIDAAVRFGGAKMQGREGYEWAWKNFPTWAPHKTARGMCGVQHDNGDLGMVWDSPEFTSSVDAAIALVAKVLPGWEWNVSNDNRARTGSSPRPWAAVTSPAWWEIEENEDFYEAFASTPAIALCLASLRALSKQGDRTE